MNEALEEATEGEESEAGPLSHTIVMLFVGIVMVVSLIMGGIYFLGTPQEPGVGLPTEPVQTPSPPQPPAPPEVPETPPPTPPQEPVTPPPPVPEQPAESNCVSGLSSYSFLYNKGTSELAQLVVPPDFTVNRLYGPVELANGFARIVATDASGARFDWSFRDYARPQRELFAREEWQSKLTLEAPAGIEAYYGLTAQASDIGRIINDEGRYYVEVYAFTNAERLPELAQYALDALKGECG